MARSAGRRLAGAAAGTGLDRRLSHPRVLAEQLHLALEAARMGAWDYDLRTRVLRGDARYATLLGGAPAAFSARPEEFLRHVHPEDAPLVGEAVRRAYDERGGVSQEFRVVWPDGTVHWVLALGRVVVDAEGPRRMTGVVVDVTDQRAAGARSARILERVTDAFFGLDADWRFTYVNAQAERVLGRTREGLLRRGIWSELPALVGTAFQHQFQRAVAEGAVVEFEEYLPPLRRWFEVRAFSGPEGLSVYFRDVTERRREQAERAELLAQHTAAAERAERLLHVTAALSEALTPAQVVRAVVSEGFALLGAHGGLLAVRGADDAPLRVFTSGYHEDVVRQWRELPLDLDVPVVEATREGRPIFLADREALVARYPVLAAAAEHFGTEAAVALPLVASGQPLGAIGVSFAEARSFDDDEQAFMLTLAGQCAQALERARLYEWEQQRRTVLEDRERLARDLHDTVLQRLFAAGLGLQVTARLVEDRPAAAGRVQAAVDELDETISEIRSTIFELRSPAGDEADGLGARVLAVAEETAEALGLVLRARLDGPVDALAGTEAAGHLLAVLREALTNVARHARASAAEVVLSVGDDEVVLRVADDGAGLPAGARQDGFGLPNLANRAEALGGRLAVGPGEHGGTTLEWRVPRPAPGEHRSSRAAPGVGA